MSKDFNVEQNAILDSNAQHQLVSAGAGSGKTTVLIEKLTRLILKEKVPVNSLLVVTFTVLAAEEMKGRLIASMQEQLSLTNSKEEAERILSLIEQIKVADISTIDGFASQSIKKYFYELEIAPNVEIISDATRDYYMTRAMKKSIEELSEEEEKINLLLDIFGKDQRSLDNLEQYVLNTYFNIINLDNPEEFIEKSKQAYVNSPLAEQIVNDQVCASVDTLKNAYDFDDTIYDEETKSMMNPKREALNAIDNKNSLKENLTALFGLDLNKYGKELCKQYESVSYLNTKVKELDDYRAFLLRKGIDASFDEKGTEILNYFNYFIELLQKFMQNYATLKAKNNLLDFNDLTRLMLELLSVDKIKQEFHNKYKYIFVDECQDINPLQDKLLCELCGKDTHTFMVGDVKQSIYGFRGAVPELFLQKYDAYKENSTLGSAFDMKCNYRSNPTILAFIDEKFSEFMTKE
ncbi:MAG: UvrD-helicase domain-containing protein, partial [Clostridia bacterium]|nr:UvrD-helicase domain-containing protein [Clostridia bacterium]